MFEFMPSLYYWLFLLIMFSLLHESVMTGFKYCVAAWAVTSILFFSDEVYKQYNFYEGTVPVSKIAVGVIKSSPSGATIVPSLYEELNVEKRSSDLVGTGTYHCQDFVSSTVEPVMFGLIQPSKPKSSVVTSISKYNDRLICCPDGAKGTVAMKERDNSVILRCPMTNTTHIVTLNGVGLDDLTLKSKS